jgi:hypothetical protein
MGMKKVKKITEREIVEIVNTLLEQESEDNIVRLTPNEVKKYYEDVYYEDFTLLKKFRGKKIYVTGDLDLRNMPIKTLGGIDYVDGKLDISHTNIKTLGNTKVKGYVSDWATPLEKARIAAERAAERAKADGRRDDGEWDLETYPDDEETIVANALWEYLVSSGEVNMLTPEKKIELKVLEEKLNELKNRYEQEEDDTDLIDELFDEIEKVEEEIEELKENTGDVYNLSPLDYKFYGLYTFRVIGLDVSYNDEWSIGTYEQAEESALEYYKNLIDDIGIEGLGKNFIESHIDVEKVQIEAEQMYEDWVRQEPDSYFSDSDFDNSDIEDQISELEDEVSDMEEQLREIEDSDSDEYNQLQELIDEKNEQIEKLEESKITEPTEEMIEEKVSELVEDATDNPLSWLENLGYTDLKDFVDYDSLAEDLRDSDGIGGMNGYNGDYDTTEFNGKTYVVMQTNG